MIQSQQKTARPVWRGLSIGAVTCLTLAVAAIGPSFTGHAPAAAQNASLPDLAQSGWSRDESLSSIGIDRYTSKSGAVSVDLLAFPATEKSAKDWSLHFINTMLKPDTDAGIKFHLLDEDEMKAGTSTGPMNTSEPGMDMSTHTVMVLRPKPAGNLIMMVRTIIRDGAPVQVSLRTLPNGKATDAETAQAAKISYDARLPVNASAAVLGLDAMIPVMTAGLIYPDRGAATSNAPSKATRKTSKTTPAERPAAKARSSKPVARSGYAPPLVNIPGPRVKRTGKMLGKLPAGYRMHIWTTNYWTNSDMTATRMKHLHLTQDGQFEKGSFSIAGSADGRTGTTTVRNKDGSTGSVLGSTNPGASTGAKSVYLKTRKGLDPTQYGTYYISGNKIELRYATGETVKHAFKTDGYRTLLLDDKKYFVRAPKGWELFRNDKNSVYRDLAGAYTIRVSKIKGSVPDGESWMRSMIANGKKKNLIRSAGPISHHKGGRHGVVKSTMVIKDVNGNWITRDVYVRYGANSSVSRLIRAERFKGAKGEDKVLSFIADL